MIPLSADLGEGAPREDELWPLIAAANVACGGHVGDDASMRAAALQATQHGVQFGAHPSYPDREHFGRRSLTIAPEVLRQSLVEQITTLARHAPVRHVKPHGALYNDAHHDRRLAAVIVDAIRACGSDIAIVAPDQSAMAACARAAGMRVIREAFADRRYEPDGSLTARAVEGSTLSIEESVEQVELLQRAGCVIARNGSRIGVPFDTICIHADMDGALERARALRMRKR